MTINLFAPLSVFYQRCIQTFAVLLMVFLAFLAHTMGLIVWLLLLLTPVWPIAVLYGTFVIAWDRDISSNGGRRVNFIRNSSLWNYYCDYFPIQLVKTADLDSKKNYIFGYHPHGIMAGGAFGHFATNGSGFDKIFPGFKPYLLVMKIFFRFPFFRDIFLSFGMCDVSKNSICYICTKEGGGNIAVVIVGGAAESLDARPGSFTVILKDRKGFIKMALSTGASLVPVFSFGENDMYIQPFNRRGSYLRAIQECVRKWLTFAPVFFYGRGIIQNTFGFMPYRCKITSVVGEPINVEKKTCISNEDIDQLHEIYIRHLKELFEKYKSIYADLPDAELEII